MCVRRTGERNQSGQVSQKAAPDLDALVQRLSVELQGRSGDSSAPQRLRWVSASVGDTIKMFGIDEVLFFQSDEKYTRVVTADLEALIKTPIRELMDGLDPEVFWQIHRSTLVSVNAIAGVTRDFRGRQIVAVKGHSKRTAEAYTHWARELFLFCKNKRPQEWSAADVVPSLVPFTAWRQIWMEKSNSSPDVFLRIPRNRSFPVRTFSSIRIASIRATRKWPPRNRLCRLVIASTS